VRILALSNQLDAAGGLERTQLTNCAGLAARGHRLDLVYVSDGAFSADWRSFTTTTDRVTATLPRRAAPFRSSWAAGSAVRRARRLRSDVVYAYRYWDLPFAVAVAARAPTAVVYHLCLPPPEPVPRWLRPVLARVDATVSVSADTLDRWRGTGLPVNQGTVALTSVDLDAYRPAPDAGRRAARAALGVGADDFVVLFAGRLSPDKGVDVLVRAFGQLLRRAGDCRLVVVGSPGVNADATEAARYTDQLHQLAQGLPVTWLPRQSDVTPMLAAADVAVVPSLWPEPLARSILEGLASGLPVVATRVGGSPEILTGWLADWLVEPGDVDGLAACLEGLHGWRRSRPDLGARCRQAAQDRLTLDDELDLIEAAMLGARARAGRGAVAEPGGPGPAGRS